MKKIKKLLAFGLALMMCLGMAVTASATEVPEEPTSPTGENYSITVKGAMEGETYKIYKMLDLAVHQNNKNEYDGFSYTLNEDWKDFWTGNGQGASYITTNGVGTSTYVVWKDTNADMEAFGKAAAAAAEDKMPINTVVAGADGVTFTGLEGGYYLITSTYGTAVTIGSTPGNNNPTIQEKNTDNTGDKDVKEDSTGVWGEKNDAQIGDVLEFRGKVSIAKNSIKVVYHDTMTAGLTFDPSSVKVYTDAELTSELDAANYTLVTTEIGTDTFQVQFADAYVATLTAPATDLYISYQATLNSAAGVEIPETNSVKITWGDNGETETEIKTTTETHSFQINKYDGTDTERNPLAGAKFQIFTAAEGGTALDLAVSADGSTYRVIKKGADGETVGTLPTGYTVVADNTIVTLASAPITVVGVDSGKYYLEETEAPVGYNKLENRVEVEVNVQNNLVSDVENLSGNLLPSTGGIGTTIFYVVGGLLAAGAGIILITKKRMKKEQ